MKSISFALTPLAIMLLVGGGTMFANSRLEKRAEENCTLHWQTLGYIPKFVNGRCYVQTKSGRFVPAPDDVSWERLAEAAK